MGNRIGILGGGQLGKMLYSAGAKLDLDLHFMDNMEEGPVSKVAKHYQKGTIQDYDDVLGFSSDKDVMTIEIEKVSVKALKEIAAQGTLVFPQPDIIATIQDKGLQKEFYQKHSLPSSRFRTYVNKDQIKSDVNKGIWSYPFIQKLRKDGYDGRGVKVISSPQELEAGFDPPSLVEEMIEIEKELAVVTCRGRDGSIKLYDPVEMVFHPKQNILLYQLAPARIEESICNSAMDLAQKVSESFGIVGLLAIEMFLTSSGEILINEVAPRPHNSGHHTIEATYCSQYENHLRAICGLPMGSSATIRPSLLMNVLGEDGYKGKAYYEGFHEVLSIEGVNLHKYGKADTKPFRKMGHITVVGDDYNDLIDKYDQICRTLRVISRP